MIHEKAKPWPSESGKQALSGEEPGPDSGAAQDAQRAHQEGEQHPAGDVVNHPAHYTQHPSGVECITITEHYGFNIGNAIKYLWRSAHKNGIDDLRKAVWYINREIERLKS